MGSFRSHPSWVCGLKLSDSEFEKMVAKVTPFVGVWIETGREWLPENKLCVTPFVGVWIETAHLRNCSTVRGSHPSWVCGLKPGGGSQGGDGLESHPSWVCGLKHILKRFHTIEFRSHPSWVCGLKQFVAVIMSHLIGHTLRGCVD